MTEEDIQRYSRQLILPGWGTSEQEILLSSIVSVPSSLPAAVFYLSAAGIRNFRISPGLSTNPAQDYERIKAAIESFDPKTTLVSSLAQSDSGSSASISHLQTPSELIYSDVNIIEETRLIVDNFGNQLAGLQFLSSGFHLLASSTAALAIINKLLRN